MYRPLFHREQWTIGLLGQSAENLVAEGLHAPIHWLTPPANGFLADPCAQRLPDGRLIVFAEKFDYRSAKGSIVWAAIDIDRFEQTEFRELLDLPTHLSYPMPFFWDGRWWLFCESWEARCLLVFCAEDIEGPWRLAERLLEGVGVVDPTLFAHDGAWYLFYTRQDDCPNDHLRLMWADNPLGPWHHHAHSVVAKSAMGGRPGGRIFKLPDGRLIRPGQDCRHTYGGGLALFSIDKIGASDYSETLLRTIPPQSGEWSSGLHTLSPIDEHFCLVDGKRWIRDSINPLLILKRYISTTFRRRRAPSLIP